MHAQNSTTPFKEKDEAQTRWEDIHHLENILGSKCILDVCATQSTSKGKFWMGPGGIREDALQTPAWVVCDNGVLEHQSMAYGGFAYCNPPFSNIEPWFRRCFMESEYFMVVGCCHNDPSSGWWQKYVELATFIIVPNGNQSRRTFLRPNGGEFTSIDTKTGKIKLSSPTGGVCFPVWCKPRIAQPVIIKSQFPVVNRHL